MLLKISCWRRRRLRLRFFPLDCGNLSFSLDLARNRREVRAASRAGVYEVRLRRWLLFCNLLLSYLRLQGNLSSIQKIFAITCSIETRAIRLHHLTLAPVICTN